MGITSSLKVMLNLYEVMYVQIIVFIHIHEIYYNTFVSRNSDVCKGCMAMTESLHYNSVYVVCNGQKTFEHSWMQIILVVSNLLCCDH